MKIYKVLKNDHRLVKKLLNKLDDTTERSHKERIHLLAELKEALLPHARAEEQVLYEALKKSGLDKADELAFEGFEEHLVADHLILELEGTQTNDKRWGALMSVLKENIEHHIKEEEDGLFSKSRKAFDSDTANFMAENFVVLKGMFLQELREGKSLEQPTSHSI